MNNKKLILIAGGTASGKSMVAEQLANQYHATNKVVTLLTIDNYYKTLNQLNVKKHSEVNWDSPDSFDWDRLRNDIVNLLENKSIEIQNYNYGTGFYFDEIINVPSGDVIIVEGIYGLFDEKIRSLANILIYVDVDSDIRMIRRIKRDSEGRYAHNFDSSDFIVKWEESIKPMHNKYIQPTIEYADIIVKNNKELNKKEKSSLIDLLQTLVVK